jgi:hypothetical protein
MGHWPWGRILVIIGNEEVKRADALPVGASPEFKTPWVAGNIRPSCQSYLLLTHLKNSGGLVRTDCLVTSLDIDRVQILRKTAYYR